MGPRDNDVRNGALALHPGADDNASGSVALLMVASMLKAQAETSPLRPRRTIVFVWFGAEERGLHGSYYFTQHPDEITVGLDTCVGMICPDMIGSVRQRQLWAFDSDDTSPAMYKAARDASRAIGDALTIDLEYEAPGSSDNLNFSRIGIPAVLVNSAFGRGDRARRMHDHYHTPRDTAASLNAEGAAWAIRFMAAWASNMAGEPYHWRSIFERADTPS